MPTWKRAIVSFLAFIIGVDVVGSMRTGDGEGTSYPPFDEFLQEE